MYSMSSFSLTENILPVPVYPQKHEPPRLHFDQQATTRFLHDNFSGFTVITNLYGSHSIESVQKDNA